MLDEMYNNKKDNKIDIDRICIKDDLNTADTNYKKFTNINTKLTLNDSCNSGNNIKHVIDLKLEDDYPYPTDIYKTVIMFEAKQK